MNKTYVDAVRLLLEVAPVIFQKPSFAMKGGTAINLFVHDMPRLSVDIDVVYANHTSSREDALKAISSALDAAKKQLARMGVEADVTSTANAEEIKMFARKGRSQVKVEVNHVFRGCILPAEPRRLAEAARSLFATDFTIPTLQSSELYGSKLVAAMDRQHPRDFFDTRGMYASDGLTPEIVECFVSYLAGHNRPVHEVLFSREQDIGPAFENEFSGMTREPIALAELRAVRDRIRRDLPAALTEAHRNFLLELVAGEPDWNLMKCKHLAEMPAIRWKLQNLAKLKKTNPKKFSQQTDELRSRFGC